MLFNSFSYALFLPLVFVLYWLPRSHRLLQLRGLMIQQNTESRPK